MHTKTRPLWIALLLGFAVIAQVDAAVAPKDNAPGVGQGRCTCTCAGKMKSDPIQSDSYNAPFGDTKNCGMLDGRSCRVINTAGKLRDGITGNCEPASGTSPGKVLPTPPAQRK